MAENVFRFSMSQDASGKLVDMTAVNEVVQLSNKAVEVNKQLEEGLSALNVARGGQNGLKGFICEQLEASARDGKIRHVRVIDDNGLADLVIEKGKSQKFVQVKCGYKPGQIDWSKYKDMDVVYINRDHPQFSKMKEEALRHGIKKVEPTICTSTQCEELADAMRLEAKITGNPHAVFVPHVYTKAQAIKLVHLRGVAAAKACAKVGGAVALSTNIVDVLTGDKTVEQAIKDTATSTAESALIGYAGNAVLSTAVGQSVRKAALKVSGDIAASASSTIYSTVAGKAAMKGVSAAEAYVGGLATDAVLVSTGVAAATVAEVGSTAAAVTGVMGLTGTSAAITSASLGAAGALGAVAASPLAPLAVAGAATYGGYKLIKKIFD